MNTAKREAIWFLVLFAIPALGLVVFGLVQPSPIPITQRVCTLEDSCAYGYCFVVPGFIYVAFRGIPLLLSQK